MVKVQNPNGLTKGIDHVMVATGVERIAAIVASDRDRYAALAHFVDWRDAAPARRPSANPVLKIKIYGWQRDHRDTRLGAEIEGSANLLLGLDRKAATMATNHATLEPVAQNCLRDMRERGRRRMPLSSTCRSTSRPRSEARRSIVSRSEAILSSNRPVNAADSTRAAADYAT
jgi:hypothetical protein